MANCTSDYAALASQIDSCNIRTGLIQIAATLCDDIETLDPIENTQRNLNIATTALPAFVDTRFDISEIVSIQIPVGSLVGNTIVAQQDGVYRIGVGLSIPIAASAGTLTFTIQVNSVVKSTVTIPYSNTVVTNWANEFIKKLSANDVVEFWATGNIAVSPTITTDIELVIG